MTRRANRSLNIKNQSPIRFLFLFRYAGGQPIYLSAQNVKRFSINASEKHNMAVCPTINAIDASVVVRTNTHMQPGSPNPSNRILWIAGIASGCIYILGDIATGRWIMGFFFKALPIWVLAFVSFRAAFRSRDVGGWLVGLGLVAGSIGDVALAFALFVPGLVAFLIGHLFYLAAWMREFRFDPTRSIVAAAVLGISLEIAWWLTPALPGELVGPVFAYISILALMAGLAFLRRPRLLMVPLGAVLFVVSDTIIAINRFQSPVPLSGLWIMLTYYAAQAMIALGYLRERSSRAPGS